MGGLLGGPVVGGLVDWVTSVFYGRDGAELYDFHHRRRAAGRVGTQRSHTSRTPGQRDV